MADTDHPDRTPRHTYLLSLWQEGRSWRAALRPADGGPRKVFGDLDQLMAFLLRLQDEPVLAHQGEAAVTTERSRSDDHTKRRAAHTDI